MKDFKWPWWLYKDHGLGKFWWYRLVAVVYAISSVIFLFAVWMDFSYYPNPIWKASYSIQCSNGGDIFWKDHLKWRDFGTLEGATFLKNPQENNIAVLRCGYKHLSRDLFSEFATNLSKDELHDEVVNLETTRQIDYDVILTSSDEKPWDYTVHVLQNIVYVLIVAMILFAIRCLFLFIAVGRTKEQ